MVGAEKADVKAPPKEQAGEVPAQAKDGGPSAKEEKARTPTPQDVEHLKDLARRKDGVGAMAAKALEQMSKDAGDPKLRDLAREALKEVGAKTTPGDSSSGGPPPMTTQAKPAGAPDATPGEANPKGPPSGPSAAQPPGKAPNPSAQATGKDSVGAGGVRPGPGVRPGDDGKPDAARKDLARFGGELQIEDFIRRATPEYRAKAGISDEEWQRFLARAAEYDKMLRELPAQAKGKTPSEARGKAGTLSGFGPGQVQGPHDAGAAGDPGRAETPPELLDAQRRFTGGKSTGPMP